jgi:hypothetical protein
MEKSVNKCPPNIQDVHLSQLKPDPKTTESVPKEIVLTQLELSQALFKAGLGPSMVLDVTNQFFNKGAAEKINDSGLNSSFDSNISSPRSSREASFLSPIPESAFIGESASHGLEKPSAMIPTDLLAELDSQIEKEISLRTNDERSSEVGGKLKVFLQTSTLPTKTLVLRCLKGQTPDYTSPLLVPELDQLLTDFLFSGFDDDSRSSS